MRKENIYNNSIFAASRAFFLWLWVSYQRTQINGCKRKFWAFLGSSRPRFWCPVIPITFAAVDACQGYHHHRPKVYGGHFLQPITRALYAQIYYGVYIYHFLLLYNISTIYHFLRAVTIGEDTIFYTNIITL